MTGEAHAHGSNCDQMKPIPILTHVPTSSSSSPTTRATAISGTPAIPSSRRRTSTRSPPSRRNLTDYHVAPTCSPTRAALLTGHWTDRTGVWHTVNGRSMLRENEVTLAQMLKDAGYATGMFGKWHLGDNFPYRPEDRGFTEVYRHGGGGVGQTPDLWDNAYFDGRYFHNGRVVPAEGFLHRRVLRAGAPFHPRAGEEAAVLRLHHDQRPARSAARAAKVSRHVRRPAAAIAAFFGMITNIDDNVGATRELLRELGIETTRSSFSPPTTAPPPARDVFNAGMRGAKGSEYEGGHRVPFIAHWPAAGWNRKHVNDTLCHAVDIVPTLLEITGAKKPDAVKFDGIPSARCSIPPPKSATGRTTACSSPTRSASAIRSSGSRPPSCRPVAAGERQGALRHRSRSRAAEERHRRPSRQAAGCGRSTTPGGPNWSRRSPRPRRFISGHPGASRRQPHRTRLDSGGFAAVEPAAHPPGRRLRPGAARKAKGKASRAPPIRRLRAPRPLGGESPHAGRLRRSACAAGRSRPTSRARTSLFILVDDQSPFDLKIYNPANAAGDAEHRPAGARGMVFDGAYHMGAFSRRGLHAVAAHDHERPHGVAFADRAAGDAKGALPARPGAATIPPSSTAPVTPRCAPASRATATRRPTSCSPSATTPPSAAALPKPAAPGTATA
jgi:hypothetical protein